VERVLAFPSHANACYPLKMILQDVHDIAFPAKIVYQQFEETVYHETLSLTSSFALYTSYISRIGSIMEATVKFFRPHHDEMAYRGTLSTQQEKLGEINMRSILTTYLCRMGLR
jgi:hypothetical protein